MDEQEFVRTWALAQVTPGINLLKLTVLIGFKLRGWAGVFLMVVGLLAPTALATALMTAGFALIRGMPAVQAVMKGVLPATIGLSLAMSVQMAQPLFARAYREGPGRMGVSVAVMACAALLMATGWISPVLLLLLAGGITALLMAAVPARPVRTQAQSVTEKESLP
jgi:chromate transporter